MGNSVSHGHPGRFVIPPASSVAPASHADDSSEGTPDPNESLSPLAVQAILHQETSSSTHTPPPTPNTPRHRHHLAGLTIPSTFERHPAPEGHALVPGHGHGAVVVRSPLSSTDSPSTPSLPRASARASRRSSLFSSGAENATAAEDPWSDAARERLMMPSIADAHEDLSDSERDSSEHGRGSMEDGGVGLGSRESPLSSSSMRQ